MKKKDRRNLGLVILFLAPCGVLYFFTLEDVTPERWLLLAVIAGWLLAGLWNLITGRSLVADIAPFLVMPFGIVTLVRWIMRKLWGVAH